MDNLPLRGLIFHFFVAASMLQQPLEQSLAQLQPPPSCIISDVTLQWTSDVACKFGVPRISFHAISCFSLLCSQNIIHYKPHESVSSESEYFVVPGLPDRVEFCKAQVQQIINPPALFDRMKEVERTDYGVIVNSFYELEEGYADGYKKSKGGKVWCVGPVSLCNKESLDKVERGDKVSIRAKECLQWLDSREPGSVVYACFGSMCRIITSQLIEIGLGLEASNRPFIWVIKESDRTMEFQKWFVEEGFEERIKGRGFVIWGWAPQVQILSHPAIGGFLTHCGWNSSLEGVSAGVPMITWPLFSDQFFNEKLIVQILNIGVKVGAGLAVEWGEEEKIGVLVKWGQIKEAVERLMDGEEGEERRRRAREIGETANKAMKMEGSSHSDMTNLIQDISHQASR